MTTTKTADVEGTLAQIYALAGAGCDIVRCTCNEPDAAEGLAQIVPRSPVPIVADIHFQYSWRWPRSTPACTASGSTRATSASPNTSRTSREAQGPRRADPHRRERRLARPGPVREVRRHRPPEAMVESAQRELGVLRRGRLRRREDLGEGVERAADDRRVPPAGRRHRPPAAPRGHRGRPAAGGLVKATAGIATLLAEGIGDTIRYSLTADPVEEAKAGRQLLETLGLRERKGLDLIACPSCGRAEIDVIKSPTTRRPRSTA